MASTAAASATAAAADDGLRPRLRPNAAPADLADVPGVLGDTRVAAPAPAQAPAQRGGAADVVLQSLLQPGLNTPLRRAMDITFVLLLLTLTGLSILTKGNPHFLFLLAIASCLWATVTWFLAELAQLPPSALQVQAQPDTQDADPSPGVVPGAPLEPLLDHRLQDGVTDRAMPPDNSSPAYPVNASNL